MANAGLLLAVTLAQHLGLGELVDNHVDLGDAPGRANPGDKMLTLVASALAGGDCIDDTDVLRTGRTAGALGCVVKAPSTLGTFLRSFRWGHVRQLDRVSRKLLTRAWAAGAGPGDAPFTIDLDSTICETYGLAKEGARDHGYTGQRGYHPLLAVAAGTGDVAETEYTPFGSEPDAVPVRLIVRRVKPTPGSQLALFTNYSYHACITDREGNTLDLEADHRRQAEIENAIRDLKYGVGLNHLPSGRFAANAAWLVVQVIAHNLARWTTRISLGEQVVTTKTLRRRFFSIAGRLTRSARRLTLHLPKRWPWENLFSSCPASIILAGWRQSPAQDQTRRYPSAGFGIPQGGRGGCRCSGKQRMAGDEGGF